MTALGGIRMNHRDEDILLTDTMRAAGKSAVPDPEEAERNARKEYQKRMKQYKNRKRRKIFGLILESVLLLIVCAGLWGVNTFVKAFDIMHDTSAMTVPSNQGGLPTLDPSAPNGPPSFVIEDENGNTEVIQYTLPSEEPTEEIVIPTKTGFSTFVVFGVDSRDSEHLDQWTQGDVVILISLNNETQEIRLCSVYRDYAFESEVNGGLGKITDSYCLYGAAHTVEAMNRNLDLNIDDYAIVNWTSVADVVDALGGIDMYLTKEEATEMRGFVYETQLVTNRSYRVLPLPQEAGTYHLNGGQTIAVARMRKGVGDDYGRTERQRKIIGLILQKAKSMKISQMSSLLAAITNNVRFSFDQMEILELMSHVMSYRIVDSAGYPFDHVSFPISTSFVYADDLEKNVSKLHSFLYGDDSYVPSGNITRISGFAKQEMSSIREKLNLN